MFGNSKKTAPSAGKAGWYIHLTVEGITHIRFERTLEDAQETWRTFFATWNIEAKIVEV
jgi:hypothetical protein